MAMSRGVGLSEIVIRGVDDPTDIAFTADLEPMIANEYARRLPKTAPGVHAGAAQAFELAFNGALADGILSAVELGMLANLAVTLGIDKDTQVAQARILAMAQARGVTISA